jgi:ATP-dependent metalloprotease
VAIHYEDNGASLSSETRALVEGEVKRLVGAAYERARALLRAREPELHALATELVEKETLTGAQIRELVDRLGKGGKGGDNAARRAAAAAAG